MNQSFNFHFSIDPSHNELSYENLRERASLDNPPCYFELESLISTLSKKLEKKDKLIRYLQRKCGQMIIKTNRKLYEKIEAMETENMRLKKNCEDLEKRLNEKKSLQQSQDGVHGRTNPLNGYIPNNSTASKLGFDREQLHHMSVQQLHKVVVSQASQIDNLKTENSYYIDFAYSQSNRKKEIQKQINQAKFYSNSRQKNPLNRSNENLNNTNLSDQIYSTNSLRKSKNHDSFYKNRRSPKKLEAAVQTLNKPKEYIAQWTQTKESSWKEIYDSESQTDLEDSIVEELEHQIQHMKIQNQILRREMQKMLRETQGLKQSGVKSINQSEGSDKYLSPIGESQIKLYINSPRNIFHEELILTLKYHYKEILQIFGIINTDYLFQECDDEKTIKEQEVTQQKLLRQICDTKFQISQLLRQYRKMQKVLEQQKQKNQGAVQSTKNQLLQIVALEKYSVELANIIHDLNNEIVLARNKQYSNKIKSKYILQEQQLIQDFIEGFASEDDTFCRTPCLNKESLICKFMQNGQASENNPLSDQNLEVQAQSFQYLNSN